MTHGCDTELSRAAGRCAQNHRLRHYCHHHQPASCTIASEVVVLILDATWLPFDHPDTSRLSASVGVANKLVRIISAARLCKHRAALQNLRVCVSPAFAIPLRCTLDLQMAVISSSGLLQTGVYFTKALNLPKFHSLNSTGKMHYAWIYWWSFFLFSLLRACCLMKIIDSYSVRPQFAWVCIHAVTTYKWLLVTIIFAHVLNCQTDAKLKEEAVFQECISLLYKV
jgi:hypothetical protein